MLGLTDCDDVSPEMKGGERMPPKAAKPAVLVVNGHGFGNDFVRELHQLGLHVRVAKGNLERIRRRLADAFDLIILPQERAEELLQEILDLTARAGTHVLIVFRGEYVALNRWSRRVTQLLMETPENTAAAIARDFHQRTNGTPSSTI